MTITTETETTTEPIHLTREWVEKTLDELVQEKGEDFVYERPAGGNCVNTVRDAGKIYPSCIVGHVIARAGVSLEDIHRHDNAGSWTLIEVLNLTWEPGVAHLLSSVQDHQDEGEPWGDSVMRAKRYAANSFDETTEVEL